MGSSFCGISEPHCSVWAILKQPGSQAQTFPSSSRCFSSLGTNTTLCAKITAPRVLRWVSRVHPRTHQCVSSAPIAVTSGPPYPFVSHQFSYCCAEGKQQPVAQSRRGKQTAGARQGRTCLARSPSALEQVYREERVPAQAFHSAPKKLCSCATRDRNYLLGSVQVTERAIVQNVMKL